ncbi:FAD binding domain-containing protein [Humitalea sp. 24SJ18S-53]|uniref:FAD binding domain-containing protein n=1 Tax=Humitalea sp. 24SJ18S-53 TaxID=3422307 RepID=UPI003D6676AA
MIRSDRGSAIVIGGSMGGVFAALLLRRAGWRVDVFERAADLAGRGAGIVSHDELACALRLAGVDPDDSLGVHVTRRRAFALDGSVVGERHHPQTVTSWDRLHGLLRQALPDEHYHPAADLRHVEPLADGVAAVFQDGRRMEADILVGADGFRSTVRGQFWPQVQPEYAGYVGWRGLVPEAALIDALGPGFADCFGFYLAPRQQIVGYPVAGIGNDLRPGHRRYNFVWYRPARSEDELPDLLTDATGRLHAVSIAPPLIRPEVTARLRADAETALCPQFRAVLRATPEPFFQPIYDIASERLVAGRVALIGDAAFVARPHVGAGVTKAAEDAVALVRTLTAASDIASGLAAYERDRLATGLRVVNWGRRLGTYLAPGHVPADFRERFAGEPTAEAFMSESASLAFLAA